MSQRLEATINTQDSALGRWTVGRWAPARDTTLFGLVDHIWYFEGAMTHSRERVFPDGTAELIVMLDEPHRDGDSASLESFPSVCINGLRTRPSVVIAPPGMCRVLGITFTPLGATALLRSSLTEVVDRTIDLRHALGRAAGELGERCADAAQTSTWNAARNAAAVLQAAIDWVVQRIGGASFEAGIDFAARTIRDARGIVSVDRIGAAMGISRAKFARRFREIAGVTPKYYARILRFNGALGKLGLTRNIATAATEFEYYDQAHMYRDFEEFARMTPGEFLAGNRYPGSPSLAEA